MPPKSPSLFSMEHGNGEAAARRPKLCVAAASSGDDCLSALPDDVLIHILLKLRNVAVAARTSVLSSRWRRLWVLLPELHFSGETESHRIRCALAAHEAPALHRLIVVVLDASTDSVAAWLPIAARRLSGDLRLVNIASGRNDARNEADPFDLPCFESASSIKLDLGRGCLGLALPPSGVFSRLTDLYLRHVQLDGPCGLGDVVSSLRCPVLRRLAVRDAWGLANLTIHSESVLQMELNSLYDLQQLTVVAPALEELTVSSCFDNVCRSSEPAVNISAPQLVMLRWSDAFNPSSVELGNVAHLERLATNYFLVYGPDEVASNASCLMMLSQFKAIHHLNLMLAYMPDIL